MAEVFLFIDTNFLMEYKPIKDIDWPTHLGVQGVRLLVTHTVTRELDTHKGMVGRKRNRAIAAINMLSQSQMVSHGHPGFGNSSILAARPGLR
jgi:hypothetical protein